MFLIIIFKEIKKNVWFSLLNQRKHLNQTTDDHLCAKLIWRNTYKYQYSQVLTISVFEITLESPLT